MAIIKNPTTVITGGGGGITPEFLGCESQAEAEYLEDIMSEDILQLTYKGELEWV